MKKSSLISLLYSLVLISCEGIGKREIDANGRFRLPDNDPDLIKAKSEAQLELSHYIDEFYKKSADTNYFFIVKMRFEENGQGEHMWVNPIRFDTFKFIGILHDQPADLLGLHQGDTITGDRLEIEDWVIYDNLHHTETGSFYENILAKREKKQ
ncbi:MAG: DUF2314 domain-containing protein [Bacteroidia bacterium]